MSLLLRYLFMLTVDGARYAIAAGLAYAALVIWAEAWRHRRIRPDAPGRAQMRREVLYSISTIGIFAAVGTGVTFGQRAGIFQLYLEGGSALWFAASIAILIVAHDAYFYWTHRLMHHKRLFRVFHRVHHMSTNPSPWAAYAFAPGEAVVHAAFVPLMTFVMPVHQLALFAFLTFMIARNVLGHLGVELLPRGFTRGWWGWSTTTTHHAQHHHRPHGNYGLYFTWWDRLLGTTDPTYDNTFESITSRAP